MKPDGRGVTVVGDDAQAIYGFRAASVRNILDFPAHYDPPACVITLERNYRSTQAILDASNAVIALARERYTKNLTTERGAGERPRLVTVEDEMRQARIRRRCRRWSSARTASTSSARRCCFARRATAQRSSSSSRGATFRS